MSARLPVGWGFASPKSPQPVRALKPPRTCSDFFKGSQCARIAYWLGRIGYVPSVEEIRAHWKVSRATAYRYHRFAQRDGETELHAPATDRGNP